MISLKMLKRDLRVAKEAWRNAAKKGATKAEMQYRKKVVENIEKEIKKLDLIS